MPSTPAQSPDVELFDNEYENEPVPAGKRRSLIAVASVWAGFPMIITGSVTGATLVHGLGFGRGVLAMLIGNAMLFGYVGGLSALAAKRGFNFSLQASRTFGSAGYVVCSALLSTLVLGWFAVQALIRPGTQVVLRSVRWESFAAWAIGSGTALLADRTAPTFSTAVVGLVCASVAYYAIASATGAVKRGRPVVAPSTDREGWLQ